MDETEKFRAELAACRARQEERKMLAVGSQEFGGRIPSPASMREGSTPPAISACPWTPLQPQTVSRGSRPQSARFVQETLTKLCDDSARCKQSGASPFASAAPSRQLSAAELPPPPPVFGVEQPQRALFTVELEKWQEAFQTSAKECIDELREVMREAGVAQFAGQLAELRAADKAENAQLREHLDELLRVNSSLRQTELEHLKGGPSLLQAWQQHFAEQEACWQEERQRWAEHSGQMEAIREWQKLREAEHIKQIASDDMHMRKMVDKLDRLEQTASAQCEKVDTLLRRSAEQAETSSARTKDAERWQDLQAAVGELKQVHAETRQDIQNNFDEMKKTAAAVPGPATSTNSQVKSVLDVVRVALGEALRETSCSAETRWRQIAVLMENLDAQLRLNHQGIEHWRKEAERWRVDVEKSREEATRCREAAQTSSDEAARMRLELRDWEACVHQTQQGCAAERGHAKSPKQARAKRVAKDRDTQLSQQGSAEAAAVIGLPNAAFGISARRDAPLTLA